MDQSKTINRYRNLLVVCILLILALFAALFEAKQDADHHHPVVEAPQVSASAEPPLFRIGEQQFSYSQLPRDFQAPLYQIRKMAFEQQMLVIEEALVDTYIKQQTAAAADPEQALTELFPDISVDDDEVLAYYEQNRNAQTPKFEQLQASLREYLLSLKREQAKRQLLTRLMVQGKAQVLFEAPSQPVD